MNTTIRIDNRILNIDLSKPIDISIPIKGSVTNVNVWYLEPPKITPVNSEKWVGSVKEGGDVNFNTINFNPHAHGTHTECVGHVTEKVYSINKCLKQYIFTAEVITVAPEQKEGDYVISDIQLKYLLKSRKPQAIIIRTMPNTKDKKSKQYSHTNWPYLTQEAAIFIRNRGIKHLLVDLPSIDKEKDGGALLAHKAFWDVGGSIRKEATITELIYVSNKIKDGKYVLNLQVAPFENDASPSKPILYKIED